jgi:hypothetical protein
MCLEGRSAGLGPIRFSGPGLALLLSIAAVACSARQEKLEVPARQRDAGPPSSLPAELVQAKAQALDLQAKTDAICGEWVAKSDEYSKMAERFGAADEGFLSYPSCTEVYELIASELSLHKKCIQAKMGVIRLLQRWNPGASASDAADKEILDLSRKAVVYRKKSFKISRVGFNRRCKGTVERAYAATPWPELDEVR